MNENDIKLLIVIGGSILTVFGTVHMFWPRLFKWQKHFMYLPEVFIDTIQTINFYMSSTVIVLGLTDIVTTLFLWNRKELVIAILTVQSILLLIRIIYGIFKPIRIPKKWVHPLFLLLFFVTFLLFTVPLVRIIMEISKS